MTSKIKIAWLHTHFLLNTGGTRYVHEVVSRLKKDFDITIFVEKSNSDWKDKFRSDGIEVVELLPISSNSPIYWLFFPFWLKSSLEKIRERTHGFDIVVTSMFPMNWISTQLGKPTVQICFEPFAFFHDPMFVASFPKPKQLFIRLMTKLYKSVDVRGSQTSERLLSLNAGVGEWVQKLYGRTPSGQTAIGVNIALFKPTPDADLQAKYSGNKVILHGTDYTAIKGTDFLIRMLPDVVKKHPRVKVIITESVSDSAAKDKLIALARQLGVLSHLDFVGSLPYTDLPKYYTLADIYVFTGHPESRGATSASLSVLEPLACGTPVVRGIGTNDEVIEGKSGYIIDPRDPDSSARAINRLLGNPSLGKRFGRWGRQYVLENYTWDHVVRNIIDQIYVLLDIHQLGFEQVKHDSRLLGMIFRHDTPIDKLKFFTDDMNPFQIGIHHQPAGVSLIPHVHLLEHPITLNSIQELIYVQSGKVRVTFYSRQGKALSVYTLFPQDSALFIAEGHGVDFLEETRLFMIKQGPYPGTQHAKLYLGKKPDDSR